MSNRISKSVLQIQTLSLTYENTPVLDGINLSVEPGEFVAILGASGCGKSTLLRVIAGLVDADCGDVLLGESQVVKSGLSMVPAHRRGVGFVFQDYALFPYQTIAQNITYGLKTDTAAEKSAATQRLLQLLDLIDLRGIADRKPDALSGGQQQRVALARALAPRPTILLLDEPFANVDANLRLQLGEGIRRIVKEEAVSVILVTHDRSEALGLADRVAVLAQGERGAFIAQYDTPERVYQEPVSAQVARLTGVVNICKVVARGNHCESLLGDIALRESATGEGIIFLRPEMLRFEEDELGNCLLSDWQFAGRHYRISCETPAGMMHIEQRFEARPVVGVRGFIRALSPGWFVKN